MNNFEIEKITNTEDTFKITVNSFFSMKFSMEELKDLSKKLNEFIEKNTRINYTYIRNRKTGRLEKIFDNE